jgi:nucleoside recognition membrane protein YjiH
MNNKPTLTGYSPTAYLKLIIFSAIGIFAFFINFSLPAYQISIFGWHFGAVGANSTMLISHLTALIRAALWTGYFKAMPAILWLFGVYCLIDVFFLRFNNCWRTSNVAKAFSVFKIAGFVFLTCTVVDFYFGVHPAFFGWYFTDIAIIGGHSISFFVLDRILIMVSITIPAAAAFLPFLTDYGLVDLVGVLARRFMRPVFMLPGRAAVIAVSALLASFVVGHLGANNDYKSGRMNQRESVVVGTSFTSASIGFMLVLAMNTNIMHLWNLYLWSTFAIILIVTIISVRLPPLSRVPEDYLEGVEPRPEIAYTSHVMRHAVKEALDTASGAEHYGKRLGKMLKECIGVLGVCATGSTFFAAVGIILHTFTPLITWVGLLFWPIMRIALSAPEAVTASSGAVLSFIELVLPSILVAAGDWTLRLRFILAVIPIASIIFLAAWVPCIMATSLRVKFSQLVIIWLQRMFLSSLLAVLLSMVLFPAGAM